MLILYCNFFLSTLIVFSTILNALNARNSDYPSVGLQNVNSASLPNLELLKNAAVTPMNARNVFNNLNSKNGVYETVNYFFGLVTYIAGT